MNKKEILIICLIMCFILSLQAAAAVDVDVDNNDTCILKINNANDVSAYTLPDSQDDSLLGSADAGTFKALQDKIDATTTGEEIILENSYTWNSGTDSGITTGITINHDMTISAEDGKVIVIDAKQQTRVFEITNGAHVTLNGITFINGKPTSGNGGSIESDGDLTIYNCTFKDNTANNGHGGAIYTSASATITKSVFKSNAAKGSEKAGGAINVGDDSVISNSTFIQNTAVGKTAGGNWAGSGGGAINAGNRLTVKDNSHFISNTVSSGDGGAINANQYAKISNSTFDSNRATNARAGAIWARHYLNVSDCNFTSNRAKNFGGAIAVENPGSLDLAPVFYNSRFVGNSLTGTGTGGGAINIRSEGYLKMVYNCTFIDNHADDGGAIKTLRLMNVVNSTFINNTATSGTGGAIRAYDSNNRDTNLNIVNSTFMGNNASAAGGAIASGRLYIYNSNFANNTAKCTSSSSSSSTTYTNGGGAIFVVADYGLVINNTNFTSNVAKADGGAIYTSGTTIPNIGYANFIGNNATNGGALLATSVTINKSNFTNNRATAEGGAINATTVTVNNGNFTSNIAGTSGGAILGSTVTINNGNFTSNRVTGTTGDGGALYISGSNSKVSNSIFDDNDATNMGGAIYWSGASGVLKYSNFTNNNATNMGGAIYWSGVSGNISRSNFNKSRSTYGGAIYIIGASTNITYSNFTDNTADISGGAIYSLCNDIHIDYSIFNDNVAKGIGSSVGGGAIYARGLNTRITSNFTNNNATGGSGGAIYTGSGERADERDNPPYITYSNFTSNHAAEEGGAIFAGFIDSQTYSCIFINNSASRGGGISMVCDDQLLKDSLFINNTAQTKGGSVYFQKITFSEIRNTTFINSSALDGGAFYSKGGSGATVDISNCTFINNTAVYNGGAVYYVVDADKYDSGKSLTRIYRDYNNFDGEGEITGGRTTVYLKNANEKSYGPRIKESLFVNNTDYPINMTVDSSLGMSANVMLTNPKGIDTNSLIIMINVTDKDDRLVGTFTINSGNYYPDHWNNVTDVFYSVFELEREQNYTAFITFYDDNHIAKSINSKFNTSVQNEGAFQILQNIINEKLGAGIHEYTLTRPYVYDSIDIKNETGCINITQDFTLYGGGWSINAQGYCRIFNISADHVTLVGLALADGNATGKHNDSVDKGGAIYWGNANGELIDCIISDSFAAVGGGIYFNESAQDCKIINSIFNRNNATGNGGAIDCNAARMQLTKTTFVENHGEYGAALCREEHATEGSGSNNTFIRNNATKGGAALGWIKAQQIKIVNYTFINNTAGESGGAIFVDHESISCEVINCTFEGNYIYDQTAGHGGAIEWYANKGTVTNSTFIRNHAFDGGAIYANDQSEEIVINNSYFEHNYAYSSGGAISLEASKVTIEGSTFRYNNATKSGGAVYVSGAAASNNVSYSVFENNWVANKINGTGGAIDWLASAGLLTHSNFTNNTAAYGGAVYLNGISHNSNISNSIFTSNYAYKNGGAIDWNATNGGLFNNQFISNNAEYGAALCREVGARGGNGTNNTFTSNHARISGAALGWMGSDNIRIVNYNFTNNTADVSGGAIYVSNSSNNCSVIDCNFIDNRVCHVGDVVSTTAFGGAIDWRGSNGTVRNSNFTGNHAYSGGAIFVGSVNGTTNITNSTFIKNTVHYEGGAICMNASSVYLNNTHFEYNTALMGGAIYVGEKGSSNIIYNSAFDNNKAFDEEGTRISHGGAIDWLSAAGQILYSNFTNNQADMGGAIYLNGKSNNTVMKYLRFEENHAVYNGGAIDWNSTNGQLYYCNFTSNTAQYGAALCREVDAKGGNGSNNIFEYNHAYKAGAALAWLGSVGIKIVNYTFNYNTANVAGAAIFINETSHNCSIINSSFTGNEILNETGGHGGAIYTIAHNTTIDNSNFTLNKAHFGGAIFVGGLGGDTNITDSIFKENSAVKDGGAIYLTSSHTILNRTNFTGNVANRDGGALYAGSTGQVNIVYNSSFEDNRAENGYGGAIDWVAAAGHINYTNFTNNKAKNGGAIHFNGNSDRSKVSYVRFESNIAEENGGAIDCDATEMELTHTYFYSNYANYGAALCREPGATGGFGHNNTFDSNHAYISGAALAWLNVSNIRINNYTFINNTADVSGGAIFVDDDSDNCKVHNCYFEENFVTNAITGRGGAIDWIGDNGDVQNTTFISCVAVEGGAIYVAETSNNFTVFNTSFTGCLAAQGNGGAIELRGDNATINLTNFTSCYSLKSGGAIAPINSDNLTIASSRFISCVSFDFGGAIAGLRSNNANITDCYFKYDHAAGHITPEGTIYGEGGAIYWGNSVNLTVSNSTFFANNAFMSGGSISANNCNDSHVYNIKTYNQTAQFNGGSISWVNSNNVTIENALFNDSGANYNGGSIYLGNVNNVTVKNATLNSTWASWGYGGGIYVGGNVTINNITLRDGHDRYDGANGIYFAAGNFTVSNSTFKETTNVMFVTKDATVKLTNNNITGDYPTKNVTYVLKNNVTNRYDVDYSVWNNGNLSLYNDYNDTFDYVIINNGTIHTHVTIYVLGNDTVNATWNTTDYLFKLHTIDDNNNTIISVKSTSWNNVTGEEGPHYPLDYNAAQLSTIYQGSYTIYAKDLGFEDYTMKTGAINVKMPTQLTVSYDDITREDIKFSVKISQPALSNYTFDENKLTVNVNGKVIPLENITLSYIPGKDKWYTVYANFTQHHMPYGTYTISADYAGDAFHEAVRNSTELSLFLRPISISVQANNISYGQTLIVDVTSNATNTVNGRILISINGRTMSVPLHLNPDGSYRYYIPNENYTSVLEPGNHIVSVIFENGTYYGVQTNSSYFNVYKLNTPIDVNYTNITYGENEIINVTVNETAEGYIALRIGSQLYVAIIDQGVAKFNITGLPAGPYDATLTFPGDNHFNATAKNIKFKVNATKKYTFDVKVDPIEYKQNATVRVLVPTNAKGNVTIFVDGIKWGTVNVTNGTAELRNISGLAGGHHDVDVRYNGDSTYAIGYKNNTDLMVNPTGNWNMTIKGDYKPYGEYSTITIGTTIGLSKHNVTIIIDNATYIVPIDVTTGKATLRLNNLSAGSHNASVSYAGDANYSSKTSKFFPSIIKATPSITLTRNANGDVVATVSGDTTGDVTFYIPGGEYNEPIDPTTGKATLPKDTLRIGMNGIIAVYTGDGNYTWALQKTMVPVYKSATDIVVGQIESKKVDEDIVISVGNLPAGATGYVIVEVEGVANYTINLTSGQDSVTIKGLSAGTYNVNATYLGDGSYNSSYDDTKSFTVSKWDSGIGVSADNTDYGKSAVIVVTSLYDDVAGTVTLTLNDTDETSITLPIYGRYVTWDVDGLAAGKYKVTAVYTGNYKYNGVNSLSDTFEVRKVAATLSIDEAFTDAVTGAEITVHINDTATGSITIRINDGDPYTEDINDGKAVFNIDILPVGDYKISAVYNPGSDKNYTGGSDELDDGLHVTNVVNYPMNVTALDVAVGVNTTITVNVPVGATGTVTIWVNRTTLTNATHGGKALFHLNKTLEGKYSVNATLIDAKYGSKTVYTEYYVYKLNTPITIDDLSAQTVGETTTITVNVPSGINTNLLTLEINGKPYTKTSASGTTVTFVITDLTHGDKTVVAKYAGDNVYKANSTTNSFTVNKHTSTITVSPIDNKKVGEDVRISVTGTDGATGYVVVEVEGVANYTINLTSGPRYVDIKGLSEGTYNVNATYVGDEKYLSSYDDTKSFTVSKWDATGIVVSAGDIDYGKPTDIVVTVPSADMTGTITLTLNDGAGTHITLPIYENKVTWDLSGLAAGDYTVTASYSGNDKYGAKGSLSYTFEVRKVNPVITVDEVTVDAVTQAEVVVHINDTAAGTIAITVNGKPYAAKNIDKGVAKFTIDTLPVGNHAVEVSYVASANANYNSKDDTLANKVHVNKVVNYQMSVSALDVAVGENTTITVAVPDGADGTVNIDVDGTPMSNATIGGKAIFHLNKTSEGRYSITATLTGDSKYADQTAYGNYYVYKADPSISITSITSPALVETGTTIVVSVPEDITNAVSLEINGKVYNNGQKEGSTVTFVVSDLAYGDKTVVAIYSGDDKYKSKSVTEQFTVGKHASSIEISAGDKNVGEAVRITVTDISDGATGYVVVEVKGIANYTINLTSGPRYIDIEGLAADTYSVNATYVGDDYYLSSYDVESFTVSRVDPTNIVVSAGNIDYGKPTNIVVTVPSADMTGTIYLELNDTAGTHITLPIYDNEVTWNLDGLAVGKYTVTATYNGNDKYNAKGSLSDTFVVGIATLTAKVNALNVTVEQNTAFAINGTDGFKGKVSIKAGDEVLYNGTVKTLVEGTKLSAGDYTATVVFYGDSNYDELTLDNVKFTVSKVTTTINVTVNDIYYPAKAVAVINIGNKANGTVNVTVKDKSSGKGKVVKGTVSNGSAVVDITGLSSGFKEAKVEFFSNDDYNNDATAFTNFIIYPNSSEIVLTEVKSSYKVDEYITFKVTTYNSTGDFYVYVNGKQEGGPHAYELGKRIYEVCLDGRGEGSYEIDVRLDKDENYSAKTTHTTVYVVKYDLTINVSDTTVPASIVVGSPVKFTAVLNESVTGDVIFNINGINYTAHVNNANNATYEYTPVNNAALTVVATFMGNDKYNSKTSQPETFDVNRKDSSVGIVAEGVVYGNDVNVIVNVDDGVEGSITIKLGDKIIGTYAILDGKVEVPLSGLAADDYTVYATYNGNDKYNDNTESKPFTVSRATPVITIDEAFTDADTGAKVTVHINDTATGNITINVNGKPYTAPINDGVAEFTVDVLPVGDYDITASYAPGSDKNYSAVSNVLKKNGLHVDKVTVYPMNVTSVDVGVGENTTITVNVPKDATGTVTIRVNGTTMSNTTHEGKALFHLNKTSEGRYSITATLAGDSKYADQTVYGNYYVYKIDAPISITDVVVDEGTTTITVAVPADIENKVTIEINGKVYDNGNKEGSTCTFIVNGLAYGDKTVVATYGGDKKYKFNSTTEQFTVDKSSSYIKVDATNGTVGGDVIINVTVSPGATGYVLINVNGTEHTINLTAGEDRVAVGGLGNGTYNVIATYAGNDAYMPSSDTTSFEVSKLNTTVRIDVDDITYGNDANITVYVDSGVEGTITVRLNSKVLGTYDIVDGKVNVIAHKPGAGDYTVYAEYNGNYKYNENRTASEGFTVDKAIPTIIIDHSIADAITPAVVYVHINPDAVGNISICLAGNGVPRYTYEAPIVDGVATFNKIPVLPVNKYNITAEFYDNEHHGIDTNYTMHSVDETYALRIVRVTDYSMSINATDVKAGENTTITVVVPENATGTVFIDVNGTWVNRRVGEGGITTFEVSKDRTGRYYVNAFLDDNKYALEYVRTYYYVEHADIPMSINVSEPIYANDTAIITVTVPKDVNSSKNGTVTIEIDGKSYSNVSFIDCFVKFEVPNISYGNKTVVAIFGGSHKYYAKSVTANFTVNKRDSSISVDATNGTVGGDVIINITATLGATGYVIVDVNGSQYAINLTAGEDRVTVKDVGYGTFDVTATYLGDDIYMTSSGSCSFDVSDTRYNMRLDATDITYGDVEEVTVYVNATGSVTIKLNGETYDTKDLSGGMVVFPIEGLSAGNYTVEATFIDPSGNVTSAKADFTVEKADPTVNVGVEDIVYGDVEQIRVNVNARGNVTVRVNGQAVYELTLENGHYVLRATRSGNSNYQGSATVDVENLNVGKYLVEVTYNGNDDYNALTVTKEFYVVKANTSVSIDVEPTMKYGETQVMNITMAAGNETGKVVINIDGEKYTRDVSNGTAEFTIPALDGGKHSIIVIYEGDGNFNANWTSATVNVEKADSSISVDATNSTAGEEVIIDVSVTSGATGYVVVDVNGVGYVINLTDGKGSITLKDLPEGEYDVTATYVGDDNYASSIDTTSFEVEKAGSFISVDATSGTPSDDVVINVTVTPGATGYVVVDVNGTGYVINLTAGEDSITIKGLPEGEYDVTATYVGDDNYASSVDTTSFKVEKASSSLSVEMTNNPTGSDQTITVRVDNDDSTGYVIVDVDGESYAVKLDHGVGNITISGLAAGNHTIHATYPGNDIYDSASDNITAELPKVPSEVSVSVENITAGNKAVIEITVPENATGTVTVNIDGNDYTTYVAGGKGTLAVSDLEVGPHKVTVTYNGDGIYDSSTDSTTFEVAKSEAGGIVKVTDQGNGTVVVEVPEYSKGNVTIKVGDDTYTGEIVDGKAVINLENATPGVHDITVTVPGDESHPDIVMDTTANIPKHNVPLDVSVNNIKVGDKAEIVVSGLGDATGEITVEIDGKSYTSTISGGEARFEIEDLTAGNKTALIKYAGDNNYESNITSASFNVSKVDAGIEVTINDTKVGENVTVNVVLPDDATGVVLIDIGGVGYYANVTDGVAHVDIPRIPSGYYDVTVTYTGDDKYSSASDEASFNMSKVDSFVIPNAIDIVYGENEVITLNVPDDATGTVTLIIDGVEYTLQANKGILGTNENPNAYTVAVSGGIGVITISGLPQGEYVVSARYNGDDKYFSVTNSTKFKVSKSKSSVDVIDQGNGTVLVKVPSDATGTVSVKLGDETYLATVENGMAWVTLDDATPGAHDITVTYSGDSQYSSSTAKSSVVIPKYESPISVDVDDINVGDTLNVEIALPEGATGKVTVEIDGKKYPATIEGGKVIVPISGLKAGDKTLIVKYSGDDNYLPNVTTAQFTVSKLPSTAKATPKDISVGTDEIITVEVPKDATGRVLVNIDGVGYYGDIINGKAKVTIPDLPAGNYNATVTYEGDDKYLASNPITVSFSVTKSKAPMSTSGEAIIVGEDETITVILPDDATGTVTITVNGQSYTEEVKDGKAVFSIRGLASGEYNILAIYSGDDKYLPSNSMNSSFTVDKAKAPMSAPGSSIVIGDDATVTVYLPEDATGTVTLKIDDKTYVEEVKDGKAVFVIPGLTPGNHKIIAIYSGDDKYEGNTTVCDVEVYDNKTPENNNGTHLKGDSSSGIPLTRYATANPILALMLVLVAIGSSRLRRYKK